MLAKNFNEYAGIQGACGAFEFFASKVAMRKSSTPWRKPATSVCNTVGASLLAKNFNEYAGIQGACGAFEFFASKLAPTGAASSNT
ncbi:hypothetical protein DJ028_04815 [Pseudomonas veronii]|nr:hypothetical protein DJ028_04815 [Pseudomonas veronii]